MAGNDRAPRENFWGAGFPSDRAPNAPTRDYYYYTRPELYLLSASCAISAAVLGPRFVLQQSTRMSSTAATSITAEAEQLPRKGPRKGAATVANAIASLWRRPPSWPPRYIWPTQA